MTRRLTPSFLTFHFAGTWMVNPWNVTGLVAT